MTDSMICFHRFVRITLLCSLVSVIQSLAWLHTNIQRPSRFIPGDATKSRWNQCHFHSSPRSKCFLRATGNNEDDNNPLSEAARTEEARRQVLSTRRKYIRSMLKIADSVRQYRMDHGFVPPIDPTTGKVLPSDSKMALTLTAFVVAVGAVTLRIGGRAALVSAVGLDFAKENPDLQQMLNQFLSYADSFGSGTEVLLFLLAWTLVKVFCFDAGGIVLALSSGILFGGVLQGAIASAFAATFGSSVAFYLAKLDTPLRQKALEFVEKYPSLRGIEKVVSEDGLKVILTLRLAPILPIPLGMYNYVYSVTNVPFRDFAGGIFLGSLKPYLLDSYLGYLGKQVVDGTVGEATGIQDILLLLVLGASVLIGVFASQIASETLDSIMKEVEAENSRKKKMRMENGQSSDDDDQDVIKEIFGIQLPQWLIGMQLAYRDADRRIENMIRIEYESKAWNHTVHDTVPPQFDPSSFPDSPERLGAGKNVDLVASLVEDLALSPCMMRAFFKYADPIFTDESVLKSSAQLLEEIKEVDLIPEQQPLIVSNQTYSARNNETFVRGDTKYNLLLILSKLRRQLEKRRDEIDATLTT